MSHPPDDIPEATSAGPPPLPPQSQGPILSGHEPTYRSAPPQGDPFSTPFASSFPGYQLTREVRRGGQGLVFQAIQKTTRRKVAIKVMREGHFGDSREKARFEREVQILAQISHSGIVAIHDSGSTPSGQFYYVMDYISGQPLDTFIEAGPKSVDEVIALFLKICDAVTAAHLKGVIHRDLKPSNILTDAAGEPHVLDFGLAKVATGMVTAASVPEVMTVTGQFMGSIPWASPEQAEGNPEKIDLRTDVYSLGVVLFQMLTGQFPYSVIGTMQEVLARIQTQDPIRPSTLNRAVNNEVETIVLKCLSKARERRYQSAGELARDLRRYQAGEAIEAKRDSLSYVLGKQLRRYKLAVAVGVGFVILVTAGFVVSTGLWRAAAQARTKAQVEADKADAAMTFLRDMLTTAVQGDHGVTVRTALDTTADKLEKAAALPGKSPLADQPLIEAKVRLVFASAYRALGLRDAAERHVQSALRLCRQVTAPSMELADSMSWLQLIRQEQGRYDEAEELATKACAIYKTVLRPGDKHYDDVPESLNNLANILVVQGKLAEAEKTCTEALELKKQLLGDRHLKVAFSLSTLAAIRMDLERFKEAEESQRQALGLFRQAAQGKPDAEVARCLRHLADLMTVQKRFAEAEAALRESGQILGAIRENPSDPDIATNLSSLAAAVLDQRRPDEAENLLRQSLDMRLKAPPPEPWSIPMTRLLLGASILAQSDPARLPEAEKLLNDGRAALDQLPESPALAKRKRPAFRRIAGEYTRLNRPDAAAAWTLGPPGG